MGYLSRENNYGDDPFVMQEEGREADESGVKLQQLKRKMTTYRHMIASANLILERRAKDIADYKAKLSQVEAEIKAAESESLERRLSRLGARAVIRFTTETGHTYAAFCAGVAGWYLTQNGMSPSRRKPILASYQLAELIGKSSVQVVKEWRKL